MRRVKGGDGFLIRKAVIPAAGVGTRLLPFSKAMPKEMLPLIIHRPNGDVVVKPVLQIIFEQLFDAGIREFCMIVGRGKRAIEDHFTIDEDILKYLEAKGQTAVAQDLEGFYRRLNESALVFINQDKPKGFGDAVLKASPFVNNESFLVHAGDDLVSGGSSALQKLFEVFGSLDADAALLVERINNPVGYGVIRGEEIGNHTIRIQELLEKPKRPPTNLAIVAIYAFKSAILQAIKELGTDDLGEIQLTQAINRLIENGSSKVYAVDLEAFGHRIDVGTAERYAKYVQTNNI